MDTMTHALAGAVISDGWFRRRLGRAATPAALGLAALPDIDSLTFLISPESAWTHHRGYTHSVFPILVAAPLIGLAAGRLSGRRGDWGAWCLLAGLCLLLHTLLDLVTSWGTMPLLPFSNARIAWDMAPILDLFVLSLSAASFVANRLLRRERVDEFMNPLAFPVVHRHPHRQRVGGLAARAAAALILVYLLIGWQQNRQTVRLAREELIRQGAAPVEVRALPIMFTYIAWHVAARDDDGSILNAVYSSYAPGPLSFVKLPGPSGDDREALLATRLGSLFAWQTQDMFAADRLEREGRDVIFMEDRRFFSLGRDGRARSAVEFPLDGAGRVGAGRVVRSRLTLAEARTEAGRLWELTWRGRVSDAAAREEPERAAAENVPGALGDI